MDARFQRRVQRYGWDRAANAYEIGWREQLKPAQQRLLEMAALNPGESVLDVACGTGIVTFEAARAVAPDGRAVGVDISDEMVSVARQVAAEGALGATTFEQMGAEKLGFTDQVFDVVLCALGLMYVPDVPASLLEQARVLKRGGRAVAADWGARAACGWAEIFPIVDHRVRSEVCPLFFQLGTGESLVREFRTAGFEDVRSERLQTVLDYPSEADALSAAFAAGPVALAYSRFDDDTRREAHADYLASIAAYREGDGYRIPGEFVIVQGRRG